MHWFLRRNYLFITSQLLLLLRQMLRLCYDIANDFQPTSVDSEEMKSKKGMLVAMVTWDEMRQVARKMQHLKVNDTEVALLSAICITCTGLLNSILTKMLTTKFVK